MQLAGVQITVLPITETSIVALDPLTAIGSMPPSSGIVDAHLKRIRSRRVNDRYPGSGSRKLPVFKRLDQAKKES